MKYKAIIFDMDGTIIDTGHIWNHATKSLITKRGVTLTPTLEEELESILNGLALPDSCKLLKERLGFSENVEELMHEKATIACSLYEQQICFINGFPEFFNQVRSHNLKTGIATNADDATLAIARKKLELDTYFGNHIYNISHVQNRCKPDPALYLYAAEQLTINPEECIAIEDSAHGVRAAKAAQMFCIGINTSKDPQQTRESDLVVNSYEEINLQDLLGISL